MRARDEDGEPYGESEVAEADMTDGSWKKQRRAGLGSRV